MEKINASSVFRLADDLKESLDLAQKWFKKICGSPPASSELPPPFLLLGLLTTNRLFTGLDTVLKKCGVAPRRILKQLHQAIMVEKPCRIEANSLTLEDYLHEALQYAQKDQPNREHPPIHAVHLLTALVVKSEDQVLRHIFRQFDLTEEKLKGAQAEYLQKKAWFTSLFLVREVVEIVFVVLFFLIIIKEGLGELRLIPSESMYPLLQINDRIVIEKVTRWWRPYRRGDIIVFYPPSTVLNQDPWSVFLRLTGFSSILYKKESNVDVAYIKRLIGLPGDKILVKPNEGVFVNGRLLKEPYVAEIATSCTIAYDYLDPTCGPITVPKGQYFFMGDNRNHSLDSRFWGTEPINRVIGRAVFRIWPLNRVGELH